MASLNIKNIKKQFGKVEVLKNISIDIEHGEFLVLVGPSGCGKSTLLNLIAGLEPITSGVIKIGDRDVTNIAPKDRDIAMVFQSYALYPSMNVRKNISFGLETRKMPRHEIEKQVSKVASMLQIEDLLDRKPAQLSGGQRQRVAMGRAIAREPSIFLFDEPLSNLDAQLRVEMRSEIKLLHKEIATTIVYVTHDQIEAMTLADRIAIMKDGKIEQFGAPREIYENPASIFVAGFVGSPSMNFIPCKIIKHGDELKISLQSQNGEKCFISTQNLCNSSKIHEGKEVILGIRPEQICAFASTEPGNQCVSKLRCEVRLIEPTGPDTLIFTNINNHKITCRIHPDKAKMPGENIDLGFDISKAILFDPDTEKRIY